VTRMHTLRVLLLGFAAAIGALPSAVAQAVDGSADSATVAEQYLLSAANQERAALGLSQLRRNPKLARAATEHARAMAEHGTISHQFPGEPELSNRAAHAGVSFSVIAENVGMATSAVTIHDLWMHSEHHRANILDPAIDSAGIAVVASGGQLYAVEDFAKTVPSISFLQQESTIGSLLSQPGLTLSTAPESVSIARETCAMPTGYAGERRPWFVMRFTSGSLTRLPAELKSQIATGHYRQAVVGACSSTEASPFSSYNIAVLLYP